MPDGTKFIDTGSLAKTTTSDYGKGEFVVKVTDHIFVEDTKDGGLRDMMAHLPSWEGWQDQSKKIEKGVPYKTTRIPQHHPTEDKLPCYCHCKGIRFDITGPNAASRKAIMKEHLDLIVPWHVGAEERQNKDNDPFWLPGEKQDRYLAGLCVCSDCRTASGFEVQPWAWIPIANIELPDRGTLVRYQSSERAWREFCGHCGATAFYGWNDTKDNRECWDVSVGLMDASSGATAQDWLEWWTGRVSYEDRAVNKPFAEELGQGVRKWAEM